MRCRVSLKLCPSRARGPAHHGAPPLPVCSSPRRGGEASPADPAARSCRAEAAEEGAPARRNGTDGPAVGGAPQEPSSPGLPPSPRSPAWCQPPMCPQVNLSLFPTPQRPSSSSRPDLCLQMAAPGIIGTIRQTEKLSPREGQFTCSRSLSRGRILEPDRGRS